MDKPILTTLSTIDSALTTLTDSLTSYTPSISSAQTLLTAESELNAHLSLLYTHTSNEIHLAHLQSLAANLEVRYREQIKSLAAIRSEILAAKLASPRNISTSAENDEKAVKGTSVDYQLVLSFARNISRFNAPRDFKPPSVLKTEAESDSKPEDTTTSIAIVPTGVTQQQQQHRPAGQPISSTEYPQSLQSPTTQPQDASISAQSHPSPEKPALSTTIDDPEIAAWLSPQSSSQFTPWPSIEQFSLSGLARVTGWIGAAETLPDEAALAAAEEEKKRIEHEREEREEAERKAREHAERMRGNSGFMQPSTEGPSVFMDLDLYDPDEE